MPWYESVKLIRQKEGDWEPVIDEVSKRLGEFIEERKAVVNN